MSAALSRRALQALDVALGGAEPTLDAVAALDANKVLYQPGVGTKTINEIEDWLVKAGRRFAVERTPHWQIQRRLGVPREEWKE